MAIKNNYPTIHPSLDLNFAGSKVVDPRVTFTRPSTATYYDGKTVAKAEENLLKYSQDFDNNVWVKNNVAVTANVSTAPDGTTSAARVISSAASFGIGQIVAGLSSSATQCTLSLWVKSNTGVDQQFRSQYGTVYQNSTATASWTRVTFTFTAGGYGSVYPVLNTVAGDSVDILIWGAQLEQRAQATAYTPTTNQPITRYQPVLMTAPANTPRIDHDPITGECKGLLIEESRTNLLTYSGDLSGATLASGSRTANALVAPDGSLSACVINGTGGATASNWNQSAAATAATMTFSCYLKTGLSSSLVSFQFLMRNATTGKNFSAGSFNQITGAVIDTGWSSVHVGNGWYRISYTNQASEAITSGDVITCYLGAIGALVYPTSVALGIWGIQLEAGAFPTSYIPTTTAQATRAADNAAMTGTNFSSWYRQDEGTAVVEYTKGLSTNAQLLVSMNSGSNDNRIELFTDAVPDSRSFPEFIATTDVVNQVINTHQTNISSNSKNKFTGAYATNNSASAFNGGSILSDSAVVLPLVHQANLGSRSGSWSLNGHIKRLTYYPKRLPNAQLQALTL